MLNEAAAKDVESVNDTIHIKEEPPDAPPVDQTQCKLLNPYTLQWTNLTYICAGGKVLRTKPLEEEGDDVRINTNIDSELTDTRGGASHNHLRRPEKTLELCPEQMNSNNDSYIHETTWNTFFAQLQNASKWNQPNQSSDEGVMQFTNRVISNLPDLDLHGLIGDFRPNQEYLSYKPTCSTILIHQRFMESWNQVNTNFCLGDIQFLNQGTLDLPHSEPHGVRRLQTYFWQPGDLLNHLEALKEFLTCTSNQRNRRILIPINFPFPDAFTHGDSKDQQLFPFLLMHAPQTFYMDQRLLSRGYLKKISRYKEGQRIFPYLAKH